MEYRKLALVVAMLSAGILVAPRDSLAQAGTDHQHEAMHHEAMQHEAMNHEAMMHMHHHDMASHGYTRAVESYKAPDVTLVDANGKEVSLHDALGGQGPVMLNFIFTTCSTICPVMSATFSQVQAKLGSNPGKVRLVSISIDPEHDTPATLKEYAKRFEAGPEWSMLTGSIEDSVAVQRAFDIYRGDKMNHEPVTFMRRAPGQPWVRINGFVNADDLLREYDKLASN